MASVAVFVDAGYLFAQGSHSISGSTLPRSQLKLNASEVVAALTKIARIKSDDARLLRIYWYDGSASGRLSLDQSAVANTDNVKLRLGQINSVGQQKGVDSLIVTDLIDLARNRAISDALLLAGDEDLRIGVQIAQSFGVRVHLLGIEAGRNSQSLLMLQEADTTSIWSKAEVARFLTAGAPIMAASTVLTARPTAVPVPTPRPKQTLEQLAADFAAGLDAEQVVRFAEYRTKNRGVPAEFDGKLLARSRELLRRDLDNSEKRTLRSHFVEAMRSRRPDLFPSISD